MRKVFLIGTKHVHQFGSGVQFGGSTCSMQQEQAFDSLLVAMCSLNCAHALCEELSFDALQERGRTSSVAMAVAGRLKIKHRLCDPGREEQKALGICDEGAIRAVGHMEGRLDRDIEMAIDNERRKREPFWLKHLLALDVWPVVFVCGSWHVQSFSKLLRDNAIDTCVVESCWDA